MPFAELTRNNLTAWRIWDKHKPSMIARYAGSHCIVLEGLIQHTMREYSPTPVSDSDWVMWEVSNGCFYLEPRTRGPSVLLNMPGYRGIVSPATAGIIFTIGGLTKMIRLSRDQEFVFQYERLLAWAACQEDSATIMDAVGLPEHKKPRRNGGVQEAPCLDRMGS